MRLDTTGSESTNANFVPELAVLPRATIRATIVGYLDFRIQRLMFGTQCHFFLPILRNTFRTSTPLKGTNYMRQLLVPLPRRSTLHHSGALVLAGAHRAAPAVRERRAVFWRTDSVPRQRTPIAD